MEFVALTTRQLDYLARQDPYLEPIFKGVFASDQLPKEKDIQTRSRQWPWSLTLVLVR